MGRVWRSERLLASAERGQVREVLDSCVGSRPGHSVSMELLSDVGFDRVYTQGRWRDAGECERIFGHDDFRLAEDGVAEGHVDAEGAPVDLSG